MGVITYPEKTGIPDDGEILLAQSNDFSTNSTSELANTTVFSYTLPGGTMGANDSIFIEAYWQITGTASTKSRSITFDGNSVGAQSGMASNVNHANTAILIMNQNSVSSQIAGNDIDDDVFYLFSSGSSESLSVDTSDDVVINFDADVDNVADSIGLASVRITLRRGKG